MRKLALEKANVDYYPKFLPYQLADNIYHDLSTIMKDEEIKSVLVSGIEHKLNRKTMVYVDANLKDYIIPKIWGSNITIKPFTNDLLEVKSLLEETLKYKFNICLVNYYATGNKYIGFHSDNEELGDIECIASLSLGVEREFQFRTKLDKQICEKINLEHNSLLVMDDGCQYNYEHCLPKCKDLAQDRLNLTFRHFKWDTYETK